MENHIPPDEGGGLEPSGPVLSKARLIEGDVLRTYTKRLHHVQACVICRRGVDCKDGRRLLAEWKSAKEAAGK
jgi:hypothetical protein